MIDYLDDDDDDDDVIGDVIKPDGGLQLEHAALMLGRLHCHCHLRGIVWYKTNQKGWAPLITYLPQTKSTNLSTKKFN